MCAGQIPQDLEEQLTQPFTEEESPGQGTRGGGEWSSKRLCADDLQVRLSSQSPAPPPPPPETTEAVFKYTLLRRRRIFDLVGLSQVERIPEGQSPTALRRAFTCKQGPALGYLTEFG